MGHTWRRIEKKEDTDQWEKEHTRMGAQHNNGMERHYPGFHKLGRVMLDYAVLFPSRNDTAVAVDVAWQALVDRAFDAVGRLHRDPYVRRQCEWYNGVHAHNRGPECVQYLWDGPFFWIRTRGGVRPPQAPTEFQAQGLNAALQGFPEEIVAAEQRLRGTTPGPAPSSAPGAGVPLPGGAPSGPGDFHSLTKEIGALVLQYAHLLGQHPVAPPAETANDLHLGTLQAHYQTLVDDAFNVIRTHRDTLLKACVYPNQQPGLCLVRVWDGLLAWVRRLGGYILWDNQGLLFPAAFWEEGVRAALSGFGEDIVLQETERAINHWVVHGTGGHPSYPLILPKGDQSWDGVRELDGAVFWATNAAGLAVSAQFARRLASTMEINLLPSNNNNPLIPLHNLCQDFVAHVPLKQRTQAVSLTQKLQAGDRLESMYCYCVLMRLVRRSESMNGRSAHPSWRGRPLQPGPSNGLDWGE